MSTTFWFELALHVTLLAACALPFGRLIAAALEGRPPRWLAATLGPLERLLYRLAGVDPAEGMAPRAYMTGILAFNGLGIVALVALQYLQRLLPLNPGNLAPPSFALALNTAVSFVTNTNWQAYAGESTLSYAVQALGLTVQNFLSAATGLAVMAFLARGLAAREGRTFGNVWADLVRSTLYVLLPLASALALTLAATGVVQNVSPPVTATTLEGAVQVLPMGPAASQVAIKQLGTNGGGFFGANSAHPYENPTPASNFLETLALLLLPVACVVAFGILVGDRRHARALLAAMTLLAALSVGAALAFEAAPNPALGGLPNLEGKETRFGVGDSALWAAETTLASNGSVNAMPDSLSPLAGGVAMVNMMVGEVVFGGVGSGLYGMVLFAVLAVFIAGLMVGRSPEYLGKRIDAADIACAVAGVVLPCVASLAPAAVACVVPSALAGLTNAGPHGLSEILYAFASAGNNNGSAFGGLNAALPFYLGWTTAAMLVGRFGVIVPTLLLAANLGRKKRVAPSAGTFPTEGPTFILLLAAVVISVGALTYFPALTLGPILDHFLTAGGRRF